MFYLIGVDHRIQHDGVEAAFPAQRESFSAYLREIVRGYNISLLAEEFNEEAMQLSMARISTVREVARELKLPHRFIDPGSRERRDMEIPSDKKLWESLGIEFLRHNSGDEKRVAEEQKKYFPQREEYWYAGLSDILAQEVLIVIGAGHIESFTQLLQSKNVASSILSKNWCLENLK